MKIEIGNANTAAMKIQGSLDTQTDRHDHADDDSNSDNCYRIRQDCAQFSFAGARKVSYY